MKHIRNNNLIYMVIQGTSSYSHITVFQAFFM